MSAYTYARSLSREARREVLAQVKRAARDKYAWPGGYPLVVTMADGAALCCDCARREYRTIAGSLYKPGAFPGWEPAGAEINWENPGEFCCHCGADLVPAYWER